MYASVIYNVGNKCPSIESTNYVCPFSELVLTLKKLSWLCLIQSHFHSSVHSGLEVLIKNSRTNNICVFVSLNSVMNLSASQSTPYRIWIALLPSSSSLYEWSAQRQQRRMGATFTYLLLESIVLMHYG